MLPNFLIPIVGVLVVVFIAFYGFKSGSLLVHLGLMAAPGIVYLVNNPGTWLILILGLVQSKLILPGIPQGLQLVHVMMAGFAFMMLARNIIVKPAGIPRVGSDFFLYGFILVLIVTASVRGIGIRALGSDQWGGMGYVKLFVSAAFLMAAKHVVLTPRQLHRAITLMVMLSLVPFIAQMIFLASNGAIYQQYRFVEAYVSGLLTSLEAAESGTGVVRLHAIGGLASSMLMASLILLKPTGIRKLIIAAAILLAVALAGLSGFRGQILSMGGLLVLYAAFSSRTYRWSRLARTAGLLLIGLVAIYPVLSHMPASVQRALSFLPNADIPHEVRMDAAYSSQWRLQVWKLALNEVPDYLWVGKGFTFSPADMMSHTARRDSVLNAFLAHNYHSGPLTLLLDLGILGFLFGTGFLIASALEVYRSMDRITAAPIFRRFYIFFAATYVYAVPSFYLVFGDARESFSAMFITLASLKVVQRTNEITLKERAAAEAAPQVAKPVRAPLPGGRRVVFG